MYYLHIIVTTHMEAIIDKFMQKIVKCKYNINDDDPLVTIALQKIYNNGITNLI